MTPATVNLLEEFARARAATPDDEDADRDSMVPIVLELLRARAASSGDDAELRAVVAAGTVGRRQAERGEPLGPCLRAVPEAGRLLWSELAAGNVADAAELSRVGTLLWEVVHDVVAQVTEGFEAATETPFDDVAERRSELLEALVLGMAEDPAFALEAVRTLGLEGTPYVVIEIEDGDPVDVGRVCRSASWLRRPAGSVGLVTLDASHLHALIEHLGRHASRPMGVSSAVNEARELPRAFAQASRAVLIRRGRPGVTAFEHALPEALLKGSPDVTEHLVSTWLRPLLELTAPDRDELVATLAAWLQEGCSASAAADRLFCHRNTVLNRIRRISELLGRDLTGPVPLELALAVRAVAGGGDVPAVLGTVPNDRSASWAPWPRQPT